MAMSAPAGILWYSPMDGDATALVGANGIAAGSPTAAEDRGGQAGGAVSFDGLADYYSIGNLGTLAAGSMSAWVRLESAADNQGVVAAGEHGGAAAVYFTLQTDVPSGGATYWRCDLDDGSSRRDVYSDSAVLLHQWQHLTVTFAGNDTLRMYVNGLQQTDLQDLAGDNDPYPMTTDGSVGSAEGLLRVLSGRIDDVGIWNERLSARRIALIHGFGLFHGLALDAPQIDAALALATPGETVAVGATIWEYRDGLPGPTGTTGGSIIGQDAFIVLDGNTGEGLQLYTGPVTAPLVINLVASNLTSFSADLGGVVTDTGNQSPLVTVFYGTTDGGTNAGGWEFGVALGAQAGTFGTTPDNLAFGTTYFFRCLAENAAGSAWAPDSMSFTTTSITPPVLGAVQVTDIAGTSVTLDGTVADTGGEAPEIAVYYGTSDGGTNPLAWSASIDLGGHPAGFSTPLSGLSPNTLHFTAVRAANPAGATWTVPSLRFTTLDQAPIWINEFMASNASTDVPNAMSGRYDDWVELRNSSGSPADLTGYYLTDNPTRPAKWSFPAGTTIPGGGFLVVFASGDDQPDLNGNLHTSFKLDAGGEYIGLIGPGLNVISEFGPGGTDFPDQEQDISYGLSPLDGSAVYFETPTPGAANHPSGFLPVADTTFFPDRGFYDHPIDVVITSATTGASIYYTIDGTEPTPAADVYQGPIPVTQTTIIRARAYKTGLRETAIDTHTYILMDTNAVDPNGLNGVLSQTRPPGYPPQLAPSGARADNYSMDPDVSLSPTYRERLLAGLQDLPSVSIALDQDGFFGLGNGIYTHPEDRGIAWERACSAELLTVDGTGSWQANCGVRVQGGASRIRSAKHGLSIRFREVYGPAKLRENVFSESPVGEFNVLALRAGYNNAWVHWAADQRLRASMIRDQWVRDAMRDMGNPAAGNGCLVHLYVNGLYWGVHNLAERQDAAHYASYNGGDEDTLFARNGSQWVDGDPTAANAAWNAMKAVVYGGNWQAIQQVLDINNYIDYQIINRYGGNADLGTGNNWRAAGGGPDQLPWQVYCWDSERVLESPTSTTMPLDPVGVRGTLESQLEYRVRFGDRVHRHFFNQGALTPQRCADRWTRWSDGLDRAIIGESARWGDYRREPPFTRDQEWIAERDRLMTHYFPTRSQFVLSLFQSQGLYPSLGAPVLSPHGGPVDPGSTVLLIPAGPGEVRYTLDGTDPRLEGGLANPAASASTTAVTSRFVRTTIVKARTYENGQWSALTEAVFRVGAEDLRVSELMYHPAGETNEFIEIVNSGTNEVSLYDVRLVNGVQFDFTGGSVPLLAPDARVLVVRDETAFVARYGSGLPVAGEYTGQLNNDGEAVTLVDALGTSVVTFAYNDGPGWPLCADGAGHSLVPLDPAPGQQDERLSYGRHWRPSALIGGSPGLPDPAPVRDVVINEVQAHTDYPAPWFSNDAIELFNTTPSAVALDDWYLSDEVTHLAKWPIPGATVLAGSQWIRFDEVTHFNNPPGAGFGLSKGGERVWVSYLPGNGQDRVVDCLGYPGLENAVSWGRYPDGTDAWYMMPVTLGQSNTLSTTLDVRITEVMYHPAPTLEHPEDNTLHEYIELYNPTANAISLFNTTGVWRITGGVEYDFPPATSLGSGARLLLVNFDPSVTTNRLDFLAAYGLADGEVVLHGPYGGKLSNRGDRVALERPQAPDTPQDPVSWVWVDEVIYFDQGDWPVAPDGSGASLTRASVTATGNDPANWTAAPATPGEGEVASLPILEAYVDPPTVNLHWQGAATTVYSVEAADTPMDGSWVSLVITNGAGPAHFSDTQSVDRVQRYYRLRRIP